MKIVQITTDNREYFQTYDAPQPIFGAAPEALLDGFASYPDAEIHVISCVRRPLAAPARLAPNTYYHRLIIPSSGWMKTLYSGCVRAVRRLVRDIQPDIVHGQGTERDCALSAVYSGRSNVVTIHGNMAELHRTGHLGRSLFGLLASRLETHALKRTSGVLCNSAYTESLAASRARRTWRVPNAVRRAFLETPLTFRSHAAVVPQLLNVGLVTPYKRQRELLETVGHMVRGGRRVHLVFAGLLPDQTEYGRAFARELQTARASGYAEHVGFLEEPDLIALMDRSDAVVHCPSEESFGLVAAEALARGLKFFGTDVGGLRDIAEGVDGAERYPDIPSLVQGIADWIDQGGVIPRQAAQHIAERYHPDAIARSHLEIYRSILAHS